MGCSFTEVELHVVRVSEIVVACYLAQDAPLVLPIGHGEVREEAIYVVRHCFEVVVRIVGNVTNVLY